MMEIKYRSAESTDGKAITDFWDKFNYESDGSIPWATVIAEDWEGSIIGCVSAQMIGNMLIVGPLLVDEGSSHYITLRLIEKLEDGLIKLGADAYYFHVPQEGSEMWEGIISNLQKRGMVRELGKEEDDTWYIRDLIGNRDNGRS